MSFWSFIFDVALLICTRLVIQISAFNCDNHEDCTLLCYDTIGTCDNGRCTCTR
uniref:AKTx n=1 Tax=Centruroides hentzi TaxID=88313 RepID=A0A2I9LNN9_9SCOR